MPKVVNLAVLSGVVVHGTGELLNALNTGDDVSSGTNAEDDAVVNPSVTVWSDFQVFQADFFPLPLNWDVTSHPVKAGKKGNA